MTHTRSVMSKISKKKSDGVRLLSNMFVELDYKVLLNIVQNNEVS